MTRPAPPVAPVASLSVPDHAGPDGGQEPLNVQHHHKPRAVCATSTLTYTHRTRPPRFSRSRSASSTDVFPVWRGEGLEQTAGYMDRCAAQAGHLVILDRRAERPWEEKVFRRREAFADRPVTVWGA